MTKIANIYERLSCWFVHPESRAVTGLWIATPPFIHLEAKSGEQEQGQAALEALGASRDGVPLPGDDDNLVAPLLQISKTTSWAAFMDKAKCVRICSEDDKLTITPNKKLRRPKGALEEIPSRSVVLSANSIPEKVAAAIAEAFLRCE